MKIVTVVAEISSQMYKAHCPSLPGCVVLAQSRQDAAEKLSQAVSGYLASLDAAAPGKIELEVLGVHQASSRPVRREATAAIHPEKLSA